MQVPLDRSGALAGRVSLCVQRRPSSGPRTGAVLALAGGPGQAATVAITDRPAIRNTLLRAFAGTAGSHDFVVFDQRGTRRSGYLSCVPARARPPRPSGGPLAAVAGAPEQTRRCARKLGARRAFYTTFDSVEDIEAARRAIGVDQLTLFGVSYGTKVAVAYARRYPSQVERLVLDSVLDRDGPDLFSRDSIAALPRVLGGVCETMCRGVTGDPVGDLSDLASRAARRRLRGRVGNGLLGGSINVAVGRKQLLEDIMLGDLDPVLRASYPAAVRAALRGDPGPVLRLHAGAAFPGVDPQLESREFSDAVFKATLCEEVAPLWGSSVASQRATVRQLLDSDPDSVFFPFDRATVGSGAYVQNCLGWPRSSRPAYRETAPVPPVPVLLLAGEDDLRTPVEAASRTAARFPDAQLVTVAATGHSILARGLSTPQSACALGAVQGFLAGPRSTLPMPLPPKALGGVPAPKSLRGPRGRVIAATLLTLRDAARLARSVNPRAPSGRGAVSVIGAGLRSGSFQARIGATLARPARIEELWLARNVYVPGVLVSAKLERNSATLRGTVRIRGEMRGRLQLNGSVVSGRVNGAPVKLRSALGA